jgi:glyoxylase-like metal-dependent hydrolase (beta-lactamase superfamily II)
MYSLSTCFLYICFAKGESQISHPHFYTTHIEWAKTFHCPVYISAEDEEWVTRRSDESDQHRRLIRGQTEEIVPGVTAVKCGGHFPGSLILHWHGNIFVADTMMIAPVCPESGYNYN